MNHYETSVIITPSLSKTEAQAIVDRLIERIKESGGGIVHQEPVLLRRLAYPIKKHTQGYEKTVEFQAPADFIAKLEIDYTREESIMRFITIRLDKHGIAYNLKKRTQKKEVVEEKEKA